jgi:excisionase family DNA binding protein
MDKETEQMISELSEKIDRLSSLILTKVVSPAPDETYKKIGSRLMSVRQASNFLGVSASTIQNWAKTRKITCYKHLGKIVFDEKDLKKYLQSARVESIQDSIQNAVNQRR